MNALCKSTSSRLCRRTSQILFAPLFSLALFGLLGSVTSAATISYSSNYSMALPNSTNIGLPQFNPLLGTLTSVDFDLSAMLSANVTAENDGPGPGSMGVDLTGFVTGNGPGPGPGFLLSTTAGIAVSAGPESVAASDGIAGSGPDFHDFGSILGSNSDSDSTVSSLATFIGLGALSFTITGNGGFLVTGIGDSSLQVASFVAEGVGEITYHYTPIPEPGTVSMLSIGILMGLFVLRPAVRRKIKFPG